MSKLTTHVLDTYHGRPAAGMMLELARLDEDWRQPAFIPLLKTITNHDGRVSAPLLEGKALVSAVYQLTFHVSAYYEAQGVECPFLLHVPLRFHIYDASQHFHVPLLVSPWSYSTYRGS
jgi:5-hydroxyisourate hydrolase